MCKCDDGAVLPKEATIDGDDEIPDSIEAKKIIKGFSLAVAFSATIGGNGTLIGSTSSIILKGYFDEKYPTYGFNFLSYMMFALPVTLIMLFSCWILLSLIWLPKR